MSAPRGSVAVVAHARSSLGVALRAGLAQRGWSVCDVGTSAPPAPWRLVAVLEDDEARALPLARDGRPKRGWIVVGSVVHAAELAQLAAQGAVVLNQDVPFLALLKRVADALETGAGARTTTASGLRQRSAELTRLVELTDRERAVLCGLVHGLDAHRIATAGSRSITTVRSQLQSVLRRLGVNSQVQAIAVAHRSGIRAGLGECIDGLHQF